MLRTLCLLALLCAPAPLVAQSEPIPDEPEERLEALTRSVKDYVITTDTAAREGVVVDTSTPARKLAPYPQPLLRFNNTVGGVVDGVVMMWTDGGRPAVLGQVFVIKSGYWLHEFQSTATSPLVLKRADDESILWQPREGGVRFQPVPNAPKPAATRVARLTQMKDLARHFQATEDFRVRAGDKDTTQYELRILPNPVYRYPEKTAVEDGAVFAFVHGTDPEVVLLLEAADDTWQFACAPLTCWAIQMKYDDKQVWSVDEQYQKSSKDTPYHIWGFK